MPKSGQRAGQKYCFQKDIPDEKSASLKSLPQHPIRHSRTANITDSPSSCPVELRRCAQPLLSDISSVGAPSQSRRIDIVFSLRVYIQAPPGYPPRHTGISHIVCPVCASYAAATRVPDEGSSAAAIHGGVCACAAVLVIFGGDCPFVRAPRPRGGSSSISLLLHTMRRGLYRLYGSVRYMHSLFHKHAAQNSLGKDAKEDTL
ncbi:hypothetical protein TSAR_008988 [Trichomalopsis sarcophagae]|uniref:Uncharacterized protein n=1 Tax=Trichomalopsis sarcophagae TaxID=543379 RepID=A0A232EVF2_9HYME|nr:hypothetical protein TSAR_008988 [Trichomalopsis sarcophagae]